MAAMVRTEATMERWVMKLVKRQNPVPKIQSLHKILLYYQNHDSEVMYIFLQDNCYFLKSLDVLLSIRS